MPTMAACCEKESWLGEGSTGTTWLSSLSGRVDGCEYAELLLFVGESGGLLVFFSDRYDNMLI